MLKKVANYTRPLQALSPSPMLPLPRQAFCPKNRFFPVARPRITQKEDRHVIHRLLSRPRPVLPRRYGDEGFKSRPNLEEGRASARLRKEERETALSSILLLTLQIPSGEKIIGYRLSGVQYIEYQRGPVTGLMIDHLSPHGPPLMRLRVDFLDGRNDLGLQ